MMIHKLAKGFEDALVEDGRVRLMLTVFVVPPLFLLAIKLWGVHVIVGWVVVLGAYTITLSVAALSKISGEGKILAVAKTLLAMMTPLVWGFILAIVYFFSYFLAVDPKSLFPE